jgi:hypothetical protein
MGCLGCEKEALNRKGANVKRSKKKRKHNTRPHRVNKAVDQNAMNRLDVFGISQVKDFIVFYELLQAVNATIDDVKAWVKKEIEKENAQNEIDVEFMRALSMFMNARPACPGCGRQLQAMAVNTHPKNQVGGKWTWLIHCDDDENCGWDTLISGSLHDHVVDARLKEIYKFIHLNEGGKEK